MPLDEVGQTFVWLFVSNVKTGTRRIICLEELSPVVRRSSRSVFDTLPLISNELNL